MDSTMLLFIFGLMVFGFTFACLVRFFAIVRDTKAKADALARWERDRAAYRYRVAWVHEDGTETEIPGSTSLADGTPDTKLGETNA